MSLHLGFLPEPNPGKKTKRWRVVGSDVFLGHIRWWTHWRRYVFEPDAGTVFDAECLRGLAEFCKDETEAHKEKLRRRKKERK